jgi:hypothetical protein
VAVSPVAVSSAAAFPPAPSADAPLPEPPPMIGPLAVAAPADEPPPAPVEPSRESPPAAAPSDIGSPISTVPVERCGAVTASIARRRGDTASILEQNGLRPDEWAEAERRWAAEIRREAEQGRRALLDAFDRAYVARLEEERGPLSARDYARLVLAAERGRLPETLAEMSLPRGAMMRIERVWLEKIGAEPELEDAVDRAIAAERGTPEGDDDE